MEKRSLDAKTMRNNEAQTITFATFSPDNDAALHLLEAVHASLPASRLKVDEETIAYHLSISSPASNDEPKPFKWSLGSGPPPHFIEKMVYHSNIDILLCPPGRTPSSYRARKSIRSTHAFLRFHPQSGALLLQVIGNRPIIYQRGDANGGDLVLTSEGRSVCTLWQQRNYIQFGSYRFMLEYALNPEQIQHFRLLRDRNVGSSNGGFHPSRHLDIVPTRSPEMYWNVWLHKRLSHKPQTSLWSGVNLENSKPVAVRRLQYTKKTRRHAQSQLRNALLFNAENGIEEGCLGVTQSWCEHSKSSPCLTKATEIADTVGATELRCCHEVFYTMDLAEHNYLTMPWAKLKFDRRFDHLYQTLLGLAQLHKRSVIHGDIRPETLFTMTDSVLEKRDAPPRASSKSLPPPKSAIAPSTWSPFSSKLPDVSLCVAPEIWTANANDADVTKIADVAQYRTTKSDIWALAASWLYVFVRPPSGILVDETIYPALKMRIDQLSERGYIKGSFLELFHQMLEWEPDDRPTAEEALAHEAWASVLSRRRSQEEDRMRSREERKRGGNGLKRVRVLSPEVDE